MSIENKKVNKFFFCADIGKKKMRKIIITDDRKKQKRMLLKSLNIFFNIEKGKKEKKHNKTKIHVVNFLPDDLNKEKGIITKKKSEESYLHNSEYIITIQELKKQKMIKIIYDFFYNILLFCINKNLSLTEISTFLSINKYIFLKLINTCPNITTLFLEYKTIMLNHSVARLPHSIKVFSFPSFKLLIKYSLNTLFKHFPFYKCVFNPSYKIYFECNDSNKNYDKTCLENCFHDDFKIGNDATSLRLNWEENANNVLEMIKLNVGCINVVNWSEESGISFIKELNQYFEKFHIKNNSTVFEVNNIKNDDNVERIVKQITHKNEFKITPSLSEEDKKKNEEKVKLNSKEQLIKKIDFLYEDLENRIMLRLGEFLENAN